MSPSQRQTVKHLVLDAGPLLSLTPLRGLANRYYTVPQVVLELRDKHAREHFEKLALAGVKVEILSPDVASVVHVTQSAKKTGDYSVLSQPDIATLALTYMLHQKQASSSTTSSQDSQPPENTSPPQMDPSSSGQEAETKEPSTSEGLEAEEDEETPPGSPNEHSEPSESSEPESDDGEGEWITPSNVALHKSKALNLVPSSTGSEVEKPMKVACMTADFAMQNVLMHMGLNLVDVDGKRIAVVKSWLLRCHACFKLCRDMNKKFCPSCGGATLLRTSVSVTAPKDGSEPKLKVHLKKNFQYRTRGTIYSIPAPKAGTSKTGPGEGLILRADQTAWLRAEKKDESRRRKEEKHMAQSMKNAEAGEAWKDPDWLPEMLTVGMSGKGRTGANGMPAIGYGKKNPNERRRRK